MKIDISALLSGAKQSIDFDYALDCGESPDGVTFTDAARVRGSITDMSGYMALSLSAEVPYTTECARCLEPVAGVFRADFTRTVAMPGVLTDGDDSDEYVIAENNAVDVDIPLTEQILFDFPSKILCKDDCKGLCPKCGKNLNLGKCSCPEREPDPRLAKLAELLKD